MSISTSLLEDERARFYRSLLYQISLKFEEIQSLVCHIYFDELAERAFIPGSLYSRRTNFLSTLENSVLEFNRFVDYIDKVVFSTEEEGKGVAYVSQEVNGLK
jgi:hypothetical protein